MMPDPLAKHRALHGSYDAACVAMGEHVDTCATCGPVQLEREAMQDIMRSSKIRTASPVMQAMFDATTRRLCADGQRLNQAALDLLHDVEADARAVQAEVSGG